MRVFFPTGIFYPSQLGGPSNSLFWLTSALRKKEIDISIVTTHRGIPLDGRLVFNKWLKQPWGDIIYLKVVHRLLPIRLILNSIVPLKKSDVVHLNSLFYSGSVPIALISIIYNRKILWSVRGELADSALGFNNWQKKFILFIIKRLAHLITFHSTSSQETLLIKKKIGTDVKVIQIQNFMLLPSLVTNTTSRNYLLFLGRIHEIKGIDKLIKALTKSEMFISKGFRLKIVGDHNSSYGKYLKELVDNLNLINHVDFLGYIDDHMTKQELLANAYCLVLPSHSENFGNVVIESLSQGTPVIASKGTPWQILKEENIGYWIDNGSTSIANAIDDVIGLDKEKYLLKRENCLSLVKTKYDVNANIDQWVKVYESVSR